MRVHHHQERFKGAYTVALVILLILLVGMVGLAGAIRLAQSAAEIGPQVGDIINFDPARRVPRDAPPRMTVNRDGAAPCVVDIRTLQFHACSRFSRFLALSQQSSTTRTRKAPSTRAVECGSADQAAFMATQLA